MKFKNKLLLSIFLFFMIICFKSCVLGSETVYLGESIILSYTQFPGITTSIGSTSAPWGFVKGPNDNITIDDTSIIEACKDSDQWGKGYGTIKVTGLKAGKTKLTAWVYYTDSYTDLNNQPKTDTKTAPTSIEIVVIDKEAEKEEEANKIKKDIDEAEKTKEDMMNAYKTIPEENADAMMIIRFIRSDSTYNNYKSLKTISVEKAKKWKETVEKGRDQNPEIKETYIPVIGTLENYINYKQGTMKESDIYAYQKKMADQLGVALNATQDTINDYRQKLATVLGEDRGTVPFNDVLTDIGVYKPTDSITGTDALRMENVASQILTVITNIGIITSVIILAVLGIKYMIGSVEEKAEYKADLVPYVVGAFILFGITTIMKILIAIGNSINAI